LAPLIPSDRLMSAKAGFLLPPISHGCARGDSTFLVGESLMRRPT